MFGPLCMDWWLHGHCADQAQAVSSAHSQQQTFPQTFQRGQSHTHPPGPAKLLCFLLFSLLHFSSFHYPYCVTKPVAGEHFCVPGFMLSNIQSLFFNTSWQASHSPSCSAWWPLGKLDMLHLNNPQHPQTSLSQSGRRLKSTCTSHFG